MTFRVSTALWTLLAVTALVAAGAAAAKPQGKWDAVTAGGEQSSTSQIGLARTANGVLHVGWQRRSGPNSYDLLHTGIDPSGRIGGPVAFITGWVGIGDVDLEAAGNSLGMWFTGRRSTDSADPLYGLFLVDSLDGGAVWQTLSVVYRDANVHGRTPSVSRGGGLQAWYDIGETVVHYGLAPGGNVWRYYPGGSTSCCSYGQNLVGDPRRVVVAWCSGGDAPNGLWWQDVNPSNGAPLGASAHLASSSTPFGGRQVRACDAAGRVPLVQRPDASFFVADSVGYPSSTLVLLWRLGGGFANVAGGAGEKRTVALAAAPDGRLWVAWTRRGTNLVFFRRSNRAVSVWGEVVSVKQPRGQVEASELDIAAQNDRLDVLGRFGSVSAGVTLFHSQVYPGLTLRARGGDVARFRVTDAGDPVAGATVRVAGRTVKTNAAGVATLDLPRGVYAARASKPKYTGDTARVRATR